MAIWTINGGSSGEYENAFLEKGIVAIGFGLRRSVADFADRNALRDHVESRNGADQLWRFYSEVNSGDTVVLPRKRVRQVAIGRITGPYAYRPELVDAAPHVHTIDWQVTDIPRSHFDQDLLNAFNSLLTLSQPRTPDAESRIRHIADIYLEQAIPTTGDQATPLGAAPATATDEDVIGADQAEEINLDQVIKERIIARFRRQYSGKDLEYLVASILQAHGYHVMQTREGPDGGIDILAGKGDLGFGEPRLCVQAKGRTTPVNLNEYSSLQGNITAFGADHGLLVSLGGFTRPVHDRNEQQSFFTIRLWGPEDLAQRLLESYDSLPQEIRSDFRDDIPLDTVQVLRRGEPGL